MSVKKFHSVLSPINVNLVSAFLFVLSCAFSSLAQPPLPTPQSINDDKPIIVNSDVVTLTVTVQDPFGRYVSGLSKKAFSVFENNAEQDIAFFSDEDAPVSVGILFDISSSMSGEKIVKARNALGEFLKTSHPSDEYFLVAFNTRAQLLLDRSRDPEAVLSKLQLVQPKANTALYDACYLGVERVTHGTHQKRAMIIISDGQDNSSRYNFTEVRRLLKESDVTVYAIGILSSRDAGSSDGIQGQAFLDELASVTGGKSFYPQTNVELDEIFTRIALELRHQYSIGFYPKNFVNDGKYRKLKLKITPPRGMPRLTIRSREGYFAVTNPK